jgi:hypothetical protein
MPVITKRGLILYLVVGIFVIAVALMSTDELYVFAPAFACIVMVLWLWMTLWARDQMIPFFDIGVFCALATLVYTVYPLLNYWQDGLQFGIHSDFRLQQYHISPKELGLFHLRHVLYLFSLVLSYALFRGKGGIAIGKPNMPGRAARHAIILFFFLMTGYFFLLQVATGFSFNTSYLPDAYANYLSRIASLPLLVLQISSKLWGILFIFKLALLYIVVSRCRQKRWLIILLLWVVLEIIHAITIRGARTDMMLFLIATALLYHRMIKPLSLRFLLMSGISVLTLFIFLGFYRSQADYNFLQSAITSADRNMFNRSNEFQSLLGTAYDVYQRKLAGAHLPWYLYINDIITVLPPQQFMCFEKVSAAEWYLREIGLSGTGLGLMWGVISQSVIGLDWLELVLRGAILGYILARFHRWYLKHQSGFLETLVYVYFCVKVYYTFRDTTFSFLSNLVWVIIPFYILLRIGTAVLSRVERTNSRFMGSSNQYGLRHVRHLRKTDI